MAKRQDSDVGSGNFSSSSLVDALVQAGVGQHELEHLVSSKKVASHMVRLLKGEGVFLPLGLPGECPISLAAPERELTGPVIDCSVAPIVPDGWEIRPEDQITTRFQEKLVWTPDAVKLHLDPYQENDISISGENLKERLEGQKVLPANVLDWLLKNPEHIPDSWKGKRIYFWGTIYRNRFGDSAVCCLDWYGDRWDREYCWLVGGWYDHEPAAVSTSAFKPTKRRAQPSTKA